MTCRCYNDRDCPASVPQDYGVTAGDTGMSDAEVLHGLLIQSR